MCNISILSLNKFWIFLTAVYETMTSVVLWSMIGIWCNETYGTMRKYNNGDDDGDDNNNAATGLGFYGPIFNPITTPRSYVGWLVNNGDKAVASVHYISTCCTIYMPYNILLNIFHKLLYDKFGVLDWCHYRMGGDPLLNQ